MKWIWASLIILGVGLRMSGDEPHAYSDEEMQKVAKNAYVCGKIRGVRDVFVDLGRETKPLDDLWEQSGCKDIEELLNLK